MQYVIWGAAHLPDPLARADGVEILARGEMLILEGPWPFAATTLACCPADSAIADLPAHAAETSGAFAVEGLSAPGSGGAFIIAAHKMLDAGGFRPYADAIPGMLQSFGVRSLARAGKVTPIAGGFVPDRGVVLEFASVEAVIDFYMSDTYRPLLDLRLRTTDPRFVVLSRDGVIPEAVRARAESFVQARR